MNYSASGAGVGTLMIDGVTTSFGTITSTSAGAVVTVNGATTAKIAMSAGDLVLLNAEIRDTTEPISAAGASLVRARDSRFVSVAGAPRPMLKR